MESHFLGIIFWLIFDTYYLRMTFEGVLDDRYLIVLRIFPPASDFRIKIRFSATMLAAFGILELCVFQSHGHIPYYG